jgi:hypothetical protein
LAARAALSSRCPPGIGRPPSWLGRRVPVSRPTRTTSCRRPGTHLSGRNPNRRPRPPCGFPRRRPRPFRGRGAGRRRSRAESQCLPAFGSGRACQLLRERVCDRPPAARGGPSAGPLRAQGREVPATSPPRCGARRGLGVPLGLLPSSIAGGSRHPPPLESAASRSSPIDRACGRAGAKERAAGSEGAVAARARRSGWRRRGSRAAERGPA